MTRALIGDTHEFAFWPGFALEVWRKIQDIDPNVSHVRNLAECTIWPNVL